MQMIDAMLKQQAACSVGSLVTWVQQQPEQQLCQLVDLRAVALAVDQGPAPVACAAGNITASVWAAGVQLLEHFAILASDHTSDSAGECSLAKQLTQQLDQSGKACSRNCKYTAR
jgi:hypothetical protein